jgi:hypothetical protein
MNRRITHPDFLNGLAVGIGALGCASLSNLASSLPYSTEGGGTDSAETHPPVLTEMAVSAPVSYDVARFGQISIANADAASSAYANAGDRSGLSWRSGTTRGV